MTVFHKTTNASYNFKAPEITADNDTKVEVVFPTTEKQTVAGVATTAVTVERTSTVVDLGELAADITVNLTIGADVPVGAILNLKAKSDGTARSVTPGTGFTGPVIAGVISKTKSMSFIYDGSKFVAMGASIQLD